MYEETLFKYRYKREPKESEIAIFYSKLEYGYTYKYRYSVYSFAKDKYLEYGKATGHSDLRKLEQKYNGIRVKCYLLPYKNEQIQK